MTRRETHACATAQQTIRQYYEGIGATDESPTASAQRWREARVKSRLELQRNVALKSSPRAVERRQADSFLVDFLGSGPPQRERQRRALQRVETIDSWFVDEEDVPTVKPNGRREVHFDHLLAHNSSVESTYTLAGLNCVLRWARISPRRLSDTMDVIIHFHGHTRHNAMKIVEIAKISGLDIPPSPLRPTLGLVPQGRLTHRYCTKDKVPVEMDRFDFPALESQKKLQAFLSEAFAKLEAELSIDNWNPAVGRILVTAHSGGGSSQSRLMRSIGSGTTRIRGFHCFDSTYDSAEANLAEGGWLDSSLRRDAAALQSLTTEDARTRYMAAKGGTLRVLFRAETKTELSAVAIDAFMDKTLRAVISDEPLRAFLRRYYRAQRVKGIHHMDIPKHFGPRLLADTATDFETTEAIDLTHPRPRPRPRPKPTESTETTPPETYPLESYIPESYTPDWNIRIGETLRSALREYMELPIRVAGVTLVVRTPYYKNADPKKVDCSAPANRTQIRYCKALAQRRAAPAALRALIARPTYRFARAGKGTAAELRDLIQAAVDADLLARDPSVDGPVDADGCRRFMIRYGLGLDCSGFVAQAINRLIDLFPGATPGDRIADPHDTGSDSLHAPSDGFRRVRHVEDLCPGDTMWLEGHIRIIVSVRASGDRVYFETAESAAGDGTLQSPGSTGPGFKHWRLVPDRRATKPNFEGYRLEWATRADAPEDAWHRNYKAYVYSHFEPLRRLLAAQGVTPQRLPVTSPTRTTEVDEDDEDAPDALPDPEDTSPNDRERIERAIQTTLEAFQNVPVRSDTAPRVFHVTVPYFINRVSSPSYARAEQRRAALLQNSALASAYNTLPERARIGKALPRDAQAVLQAAVDASAIPGPASSLSARVLKDTASDLGVGIDCSGFVSEALNTCMRALRRPERVHASSDRLRGGARHNPSEFDLVPHPAALQPGDTMWRKGHIRVVHRVELRADGSVIFTTAESSSVNRMGPCSKRWRCPSGATFDGIELERNGRFRVHTDTLAFSRFKPLGAVLGAPAAPPTPPLGARGEDAEEPPAEEPTAPAPTPPATPPPSAQSRAPAPGRSTLARNDLAQAKLDRLAAITFANAADINTFFKRQGAAGFIAWFNATLGGIMPFRRNPQDPIRISTKPLIEQRFTRYWDQIPLAFDRPRVSALDFAALMSIVLNETGGDFSAFPEKCGRGRSDERGSHPGLAYAFDAITGVKKSYNTASGNRKAGSLFDDADFIRAHGQLAGAQQLARHGQDLDGAWNGKYYPQKHFSTDEDPAKNGFCMQADFYKFRGRGVIQMTARESYLHAVKYIQAYAGSSPVLQSYKQRWSGLAPDVAATVSTTEDWDILYADAELLARGLALHSGQGPTDYRKMSTQADVFNHVPLEGEASYPDGLVGSAYRMGKRISGRPRYAATLYRDRVLALCEAMLKL